MVLAAGFVPRLRARLEKNLPKVYVSPPSLLASAVDRRVSDSIRVCVRSRCSCDADPSALANYIIALLERDQPFDELKTSCMEKLEEFLDKGQLQV
jgi:hypothetical protein